MCVGGGGWHAGVPRLIRWAGSVNILYLVGGTRFDGNAVCVCGGEAGMPGCPCLSGGQAL